jgi:hypothetical protein
MKAGVVLLHQLEQIVGSSFDDLSPDEANALAFRLQVLMTDIDCGQIRAGRLDWMNANNKRMYCRGAVTT